MQPAAGGLPQALMYGMDSGQHQEMLKKAAGLAQLDAMMKAQRADELARAAPGRAAEINTKNRLAEDEANDVGTLLGTQRAKRSNAAGAEDIKAVKQEMDKLAPFINAWDKADDGEKQAIHKALGDRGASFGKVKIGELPFAQADQLMKVLRNAQLNTPEFKTKEMADETKRYGIDIGADAKMTVADINGAYGQLKAKLAAAGKTPENEFNRLQRLASQGPEKMTTAERENYNRLVLMKAYSSVVHGDLDKGTLEIGPKGVQRVKPTITPPPKIETPATEEEPTASPTNSGVKLDLPSLTATVNGKPHKIVLQKKDAQGKVVAYKLDDGTVIPANVGR